MSSLAQDELGHAAALYGLLPTLTDDRPRRDRLRPRARRVPPLPLLDHGRGDWAMTIARRFLYDSADAVRLEALAGGRWAPLADLVRSSSARSAITGCMPSAWLDRLAAARRRAARAAAGRARRRSAPDAATVFTPLPDEQALVEAGILARRCRARGSLASVASPRCSRRLGLPMPPPATDPARGRLDHGEAVPLAVGRVHAGPPRRPGSDLVSEAGIQVGVARLGPAWAPAGPTTRPPPPSTAAVRAALPR